MVSARPCRFCGEALKGDEKKGHWCPNGCSINTAAPIGSSWYDKKDFKKDEQGLVVESGGDNGAFRRIPTCKD